MVANPKNKGNQFEIQICKKLSLYLTSKERDDLFWRSSNSGGRQTTRMKKGIETHNQSGDITATHPDGEMFMSVFTVECKNYTNINLFSLITGTEGNTIVGWWKVHLDKSREVNRHPLLIIKQNNKPILWICDRRISSRMNAYFNIEPKLISKISNLEKMHIFDFEEVMTTDPEAFKLLLNEMVKNENS